jgi:hypothetical protein
MSGIDISILEDLVPAARRAGAIEFKDEGENTEGVPVGKLTLRSSGESIFPDGRWATKAQARRIARYFGVELFES